MAAHCSERWGLNAVQTFNDEYGASIVKKVSQPTTDIKVDPTPESGDTGIDRF